MSRLYPTLLLLCISLISCAHQQHRGLLAQNASGHLTSASFAAETEQTSGTSTDLVIVETAGGLKRKVQLGNISQLVGSSPSGGLASATWSGAQVLAAGQDYVLTHPALTTGRARYLAKQAQNGLTTLLLHADGADGSTTITDSSTYATAITPVGNAQLDTALQKFGTASLLLDGTGDWITLPNTNFTPGSGNFTVEMWVYTSGVNEQCLWSVSKNAGSPFNDYVMLYMTPTNHYISAFSTGSGSFGNQTSTTAITSGQWVHVAMVRRQGTTYLYVDGVQALSFTDSYVYSSWNTVQYIGYNGPGSGNPLNGSLDEIRMTKYAAYSAAFTPAAASFGDPVQEYAPVPMAAMGAASGMQVQTLSTTTTVFRPVGAGTYDLGVGPE